MFYYVCKLRYCPEKSNFFWIRTVEFRYLLLEYFFIKTSGIKSPKKYTNLFSTDWAVDFISSFTFDVVKNTFGTKTVITCGNNLTSWLLKTNVTVSVDRLLPVLWELLIIFMRKEFSDDILGERYQSQALDQHNGN